MDLSKLGRYDIVRVLGRGAMGTVYEARDPNLDRRVAIKTITVHGLSPAGVVEYEARFRTEARSAARLQHPNIVSVYDSGREGETAYLVMEYVEGQDLKHHLARGTTYTLDQTLRIMRDLLAALGYAHAQNVVHRDVKPANLLIEADGRVKLADFGVARIQDTGDATLTRDGLVGTLKYMSPEQVQGQPVDARADLFAAGVVLYQLLTARLPFVGDGEFALIAQIIGADPPPPSTLQPALSEAIDAVLACALAKSREQRYPRADAFYEALVQACDAVQDLSTAPMPLAMADGASASRGRVGSTGSGASVGMLTQSTVTQELELVYWKDVLDSDDPLDLQGFLDRFPAGIYADLARRRLRRLGVVFVGEQTATRVEPRSPEPSTPGISAHAVESMGDSGTSPAARIQAVARPGQPDMRQNTIRALTTAGVTALFVAVITAIWWQGGNDVAVPSPADATPAPTVATPSIAPAAVGDTGASVPVVPAVAATAATAGAGGGVASRSATTPIADPGRTSAATARATAPQQEGSATAAGKPPVSVVSPAIPAKTSVASDAQATIGSGSDLQAAGAASLEKACAGRVLLGYQICLSEQCAKPMYSNDPLCQQRRAAELELKQRQSERN